MLKVTASAERAIWGLVRWAISLGGSARLVGEGVIDELKPPEHVEALPGQLALWVVDADGLPARPWRLSGKAVLRCRPLSCVTTAHECVYRQCSSDYQRTRDTWRGTASEYPSCVTSRCAQGAGVRASLSPAELALCDAEAQAAARNRDRDKPQAEKASQRATQKRRQRSGLEDEPSTIDGEQGRPDLEGDEEASGS